MGGINDIFGLSRSFMRSGYGPGEAGRLRGGGTFQVYSSREEQQAIDEPGGVRIDVIGMFHVEHGALTEGTLFGYREWTWKVKRIHGQELCGDRLGDSVEAVQVKGALE